MKVGTCEAVVTKAHACDVGSYSQTFQSEAYGYVQDKRGNAGYEQP